MPASKHIKIAMVENDIKQKDLAEMLEITAASLSKMLKNDNIGYNKAEEIANVLGYDIVWKKRDNAPANQVVNNKGNMEIGIQNINN